MNLSFLEMVRCINIIIIIIIFQWVWKEGYNIGGIRGKTEKLSLKWYRIVVVRIFMPSECYTILMFLFSLIRIIFLWSVLWYFL